VRWRESALALNRDPELENISGSGLCFCLKDGEAPPVGAELEVRMSLRDYMFQTTAWRPAAEAAWCGTTPSAVWRWSSPTSCSSPPMGSAACLSTPAVPAMATGMATDTAPTCTSPRPS
jgi:hypothetical protein